jgi:hypothetical protein
LEVSNSSLADGGNVQIWSYVGANTQQWKIEATTDGYYRLLNRNSGKALDVNGNSTADGANVHQWTYGGGLNQQWLITQLSTATAREGVPEPLSGLTVYPNPAGRGVLHVRFPAAQAGEASVVLSNALGQRAAGRAFTAQKGDNTVTLSTEGVAGGLYLLTLQEGNRRMVTKVYIK